MFYLHGKIARGAFVSALFEAVLLSMHITVAERAATAVSTLSGTIECPGARELPLVR